MRVLIAEDDAVSRDLLQTLLSEWGYEVTTACDGNEAWAILEQDSTPRLAVVDWSMPGMDGIEICQRLRARENSQYVYLILVSTRNQREDIVKGIEAGADDYVIKPFDADELKARIRAARRILDLQADLVSARETLRVQATHDHLTGLTNRLLFSDRLTQRIGQCSQSGELLAVMYVDLDRFKLINDTLGHDFGDQVLKCVAGRLSSCLRETDTLARMGGDEFTVLLNKVRSEEEACAVAGRILAELSARFAIDGREFYVTGSIGISMFPTSGRSVEELVKNADIAMYQAKQQGKNRYCLYTDAPASTSDTRFAIGTQLREALDRKEFVLYYQPVVDIRSGQVMGAEALLRWQHPERGLVLPKQFIPIAEETGLICPISAMVVETACAQNKAWQEAGYDPIVVSVNVSAQQLKQDILVSSVAKALQKSRMHPSCLQLELTESVMMQELESTTDILNRLKDMNVQISIDDFGTGYSSLNYLKRFPVDTVKIDQSFIKDIAGSQDDAAIASAMIAMAHSLKLNVVAEGVETLEQLELLQSLQCDEMQGFFISQPVPPEDFAEILRQRQLARTFVRLSA